MKKIYADSELKIEAVRACRYFAGLADDILSTIANGVSLARYERGEMVIWHGEPCTGLFIIKEGSIKLFKLSPQGRELILRIFEEGDSFNEVPVFDDGTNPINAAALEECEIWIVEPAAIQDALFKYPEMSKALILNLCQNLRQMLGVIEELSFFQVAQRMARLIEQLPADQLTGKTPSRWTQDQLAARLGTVREVAARALRELERSGAIYFSRRQIQVKDKDILKQWSQSPDEN